MKRNFIITTFMAAGFICSSVVFSSATQAISAPRVNMPVVQDEEESAAAEDSGPSLTIGSKAPALDVEHWVQNGDGHFKPVTKFESGKVYIVEFWATWCGPCIASMPHIVETQEKYKDQGVQIVSISDEDLETVEEFLERKVRGEEDKTYDELTSSYCLTTDPDGSSSEDYMRAAGQNGIPCAFIVGKSGQIEWIGHPMQMDEPLEAVVNDNWDREAFAKEMKVQQEMQTFMMKLSRTFQRDPEAALEMIEKKIQDVDDPKFAGMLMTIKLQLMLQGEEVDESKVAPAALEVLGTMKDQPMQVNALTWALYEMAEAGQLEDKQFLGKLAGIAEEAATKSPEAEAWQVWDTAGHLYYIAGDLDKAIAAQKKAADNPNSSEAPEVKEFLDKLMEEK